MKTKYNDIKKLFNDNNCKILYPLEEEYNNFRTKTNKIKYICPNGHEHEMLLANFKKKGSTCMKCFSLRKRLSFGDIFNDFKKHGYQLISPTKETYTVAYKHKFEYICPNGHKHEMRYHDFKNGNRCPECVGLLKKSTEQFIQDAYCKHGDKYNYRLVNYKGNKNKVKIICLVHGVFEQTPNSHLQGNGCNDCNTLRGKQHPSYKGYDKNIPLYDTYAKQLQPYGVECRRNKENKNILEVKCMYCDRWYIPTRSSVGCKIACINGKVRGEQNLYCSDECKHACPTFGQKLYPKDLKLNTSREVQPSLRKLVLKRDNYTCQKCNATNKELHCHHYEGIEINPIESTDTDMCITLCIDCHHETHSKDKCGIKDYRRRSC